MCKMEKVCVCVCVCVYIYIYICIYILTLSALENLQRTAINKKCKKVYTN